MLASDDGACRKLSEREREVAELYARGETYKAIARALGIAPATVRKHLYAIYQKLEVSNKIELLQRLNREAGPAPPAAELSSSVTVSPAATMPAWAERRALAVVAMEIEPSTGLDAEQRHAVLQAFQGLAEDAMRRLSGTISARTDGLIVGHFGWPEAHDDDAERAVRGGIEILDAMHALAAERSLHLDARAGAAFGTVVADPSSASELTGEALTQARRLASSGYRGRLVIDANTAALVRHMFELEPDADTAPGSPVRFLVGPVIDRPTRFDTRASGTAAAFIGREVELALLNDRWRLAENGEGQAVLIRGEPGIGKSRLAREFMKRSELANLAEVVQALPFHKHTPLHPFGGHLAAVAGVPPTSAAGGSGDAQARDLLSDLVEGARPSEAGTWRSRERRAQALRLYARMLLSPVSTAARLLVIEDIHWLDPSSLELLGCLLELHTGLPALILMTARDRELEPFERVASMTDLTLGPLSAADGRRLVASLTGKGLDGEAQAEIVERSGGIPLFMEELAQSIADRAQVVGAEDGAPGSRPIPLTLQQTIAVRLEGLGAARRAAQAAAVVGRTFDQTLLRALTGSRRAQHDADWQRLAASTLFRQMDAAGKPALHFKHALVRDAAYGSLLASECHELHRRLCRLYRKPPFRAHDSLIAQHAELAGEWGLAFEHFHRAGKDARARWALTEAIAHLERAIHALHQVGDTRSSRSLIETTLLLCECLYFSGAFQRSFDTLNGLQDEVAELGDRQLRGRAWFWLARLASRLGGRHEMTRNAARSAISDSLAAKDALTTGNAFSVLAVENFFLGKPDESVAAGRRAIDFLAKMPMSEALGFAHHYIAIAHTLAGRFDRTITTCAEVVRIGEALGQPRLICYGHSIRGWARGYVGASADAEPELRQAIDAGPDHASRVFGSGYLGHVLVEAGRHEEAVPLLAMAAKECRRFPSPQYASLFDALLAKALAESGDAAGGLEAGERAVVEACACAFRFAHGLAQRHLAQIEAGPAALTRLMRAVELFAESASHFEHARTLLALAAFADREGSDAVDADQCRRRGASLLRQLGIGTASFETCVGDATISSRKLPTIASANSGSLT